MIENLDSVSLEDKDKKNYRDYLIQNRYFSKEADPILCDLLEHIARRNFDDAIETAFDKIILNHDSSPKRNRFAAQVLNKCLDFFRILQCTLTFSKTP